MNPLISAGEFSRAQIPAWHRRSGQRVSPSGPAMYVRRSRAPSLPLALSLYRFIARQRRGVHHSAHSIWSEVCDYAWRSSRPSWTRGGGAERGNLSLFDCGNRSCRRRRPEAAGGRELVAVVSSHNKGRRQSCSSRAASPLTLTSGSHAHSLLRPLPVCVVFFSPFQKIGGAFSSVSAAERGRGRNAVAQHTISASHIHT